MAQAPFVSPRNVNPEAGDHAISADPVEQAAAEAAIRASWREFPYYAKRYGERGWRFSLSDTGWIQTLCHLTATEARAQVRWLGGVLAARGMPMYLLERHLEHLHRELVQVRPEQSARDDVLLDCARSLRESRIAQIPEALFHSLASDFDQRVRGGNENPDRRIANMGAILVAAAADELAGVGNAIASVESWACDVERFDPIWITAVRDTFAAVKALQVL
jgi:hypothetical protein